MTDVVPYHECLYFNSIKVRLKHTKVNSIRKQFIFQFHKGTIKTKLLSINLDTRLISIP